MNKFNIGDLIYLVTDPDQYERMVVGYYVSQRGVSYDLAFGSSVSSHYEIELIREKDLVKATSN